MVKEKTEVEVKNQTRLTFDCFLGGGAGVTVGGPKAGVVLR